MKHDKIIDMTGQRYHRLVVTSFHSSSRTGAKWNCLCDCGTWCVVIRDKLLSGQNKSCGCFKKEIAKQQMKTNRDVHRDPIALPTVPPREAEVPICRWFSTLPVSGCVSLRT